MQEDSVKRLQYRDLKPIMKEKFKAYLSNKEQEEGLKLPDEFLGRYAFGAYGEPGKDDWILFNLMIVGDKPEDALMILEADVSRIDGSIRSWRCHDENFVQVA